MSKTCADMARDLGAWPRCATPDCENLINHRLGQGKCYPCSLVPFGLDRAWFENMLRTAGVRPWDAESEAMLSRLERAAAASK